MGRPTVFLRGYGPKIKSPRRRRYERQRRFCCCGLPTIILLVVLVVALRGPVKHLWRRVFVGEEILPPEVPFALELSTDAQEYPRYGLVKVAVRYVDHRGMPIGEVPPDLEVRFRGETVAGVGGMDTPVLTYDQTKGEWVSRWPVPWNAKPGTYQVRATAEIYPPNWPWLTVAERQQLRKERRQEPEPPTGGRAYCVASVPIRIAAREPPEVPPGLGVLTLETAWDLRNESIVLPDGGKGDWRAVFDWCEYLGCNAFLYRAGVTDSDVGPLSLESPWAQVYIDMVPLLADEAERRGIMFGAYMIACTAYGSKENLPRYSFALDIKGGQPVRTDYISLLDSRRVSHMVGFLRAMQEERNVDFVGVDYIRTDQDGYEMATEFARDMSIEVPSAWGGWDPTQRARWVQYRVEERWKDNRNTFERWNWFRARKTASLVEKLIRFSHLRKPFWAFTLSWMHGTQHGQDPLMMTDAGLAMDGAMLYQVESQEHFQIMTDSWREYDIRPGGLNLVPGNQVDWYWHQKTRVPAGPELYYQRLRAGTAMMGGEPARRARGVFIHDLSRIVSRLPMRRGEPYPGTEWALAGAAAISRLRSDWGLYPLVLDLEVPKSHLFHSQFRVSAQISNLTEEELKDVEVSLYDTMGVTIVSGRSRTISSVPAEGKTSVPFVVRLTAPSSARANRFMIAAQATWPKGQGPEEGRNLPRKFVAFKYVNGR